MFGIFLLIRLFQALLKELEDVSIIVGCGKFGSHWRIILPLFKSARFALGIFAFLGRGNELFCPLIALNFKEIRALPVGSQFCSMKDIRPGAERTPRVPSKGATRNSYWESISQDNPQIAGVALKLVKIPLPPLG